MRTALNVPQDCGLSCRLPNSFLADVDGVIDSSGRLGSGLCNAVLDSLEGLLRGPRVNKISISGRGRL